MLNISTETGRTTEENEKPGKSEKQKRSLKGYLLEKMQVWINSLLEAERDEFLGRGRHEPLDEKHDNYRNGYRRRSINFFRLGLESKEKVRMNKGIFKRLVGCAALLTFFLLEAFQTASRSAVPSVAQHTRPIATGSLWVTLYIAGLQGTDQSGKFPTGGFVPQALAVLENIDQVVKTAGFQMKDVVSVNVYLMDMHNFVAMNRIYKSFFPDPKPNRTTVQVAALSNGALIEISAIAVKTASVHTLSAGH
ncbi:MAG: Rid family hydrolase [Terriglobia bacterium]